MTREENVKNLLTELIEMIDNGSQRDLDRADEIAKTIIKALSQEPTKREIESEYLFQSLCEDFKKLQAENDDLRKRLEQEPCTDAISRQAALNAISRIGLCKCSTNEVQAVDECLGAVEALPLVTPSCDKCAMNGSGSKYCDNCKQKSGKWIPVSERLPEEDTNVLCWYEYFRYGNYNKMYQTYGVGTYFGRFGWAGDITGDQARVIAWMPLPKPYEPQERSE